MPSAEFQRKGAFGEVVLPALLVHAVNNRFTGMFRAERESIIKVIYFKEGEIAFASSNQPSDRLGEVLIKRGQLTREQLDMAMSKLEANVSLGRMLVELGYLSPKELLAGAKTQVEEILYSLNGWKEGHYEFTEGPLPPRIVDLKLNTRQVIFQCVLQVEDRRWVLEQLGSMDSIFAPEGALGEVLPSMRLEPEVAQVINNINGNNTVRDLCARSGLDEFTVSKIVAALHMLNLVRLAVHEAPGGEFLARFGEERRETQATDATVVGRVSSSETLPGFAPGFLDEPAPAGADTHTARLDREEFALPVSPLAAEAHARTEAPAAAPPPGDEEMSFEEEGEEAEEEELEEGELEYEAPRRSWLLPAVGGLLALGLLAAAGWYFFLRTPAPDTTTASASPSPAPAASPTRPAATATPTARPVVGRTPTPAATAAAATPGAAATAAAVSPTRTAPPGASPSPTRASALPTPRPAATPIAALTPGRTPETSPRPSPTRVVLDTPRPAPTAALGQTPPLGTPRGMIPTPRPAGTAARPTPAATIASATPIRATPVPAATLRPTPPRATPVAVATPPAATSRATPAPRVTPAVTTGGSTSFATSRAAELGRTHLGEGKFREAAAAFEQAARASGGYSIQLEIVCQEQSVSEGLRQAGSSSPYVLVPFSLRGRPCYRVLWGVYPSRAAAAQARDSVPAFFRNQMRGRELPIVPVLR